LRLAALILLFLASAPANALAHRTDGPRNDTGVPITSITHGEMAIIDRHVSAVFALSGRVRDADRNFMTLARYAQLQYADCLWGLVPGSISDEESPFNECSHAYLAAAKEILLKMRDMPSVAREANQIASRISYEAALEGAAFVGCIYSGEGFNTADRVRPQWHDVPFHLPTLLTLASAFGFLPLMAFVGSRLVGRRNETPAPRASR
jgi:hypothetical protein